MLYKRLIVKCYYIYKESRLKLHNFNEYHRLADEYEEKDVRKRKWFSLEEAQKMLCALKPIQANEIPLYRHEVCLSTSVESRMRDLINDVARFGKKILIYDNHGLLAASFVEEKKDEVEWKMELPGKSAAELREESKKYSLVVELNPTHVYGGGDLASRSIPPLIDIMSVDDADELPRLRRQIDLERFRRGILNFFTSYFDKN